ncbi:MAG: hypothetical protein IJU78_00195 [Clostridia bacterium]|nr:hypothetical protein [Clostridia bacterium]
MKRRLKRIFSSEGLFLLLCLAIVWGGYVLLKGVLSDLDYTNKGYCRLLAMFGTVIAAFAYIAHSKTVMGGVALGYVIGFAAGALQEANRIYPYGMPGYMMWAIVYSGVIALAMMWSVIKKPEKK